MMKTILFQGDSITDAGRSRKDLESSGEGYALLVKSQLGYENPGEYSFHNRGVSGDRIVDVYARMKKDIINLAPDYISILLGVNDVWHEIDFGGPNGVDADKYEKIYGMLIEEIEEALPQVKIMIMEPFCLRASATDETEEQPNRWDYFNTEVKKRAEKAKQVAKKYNLTYVPLQEKFDEAAKLAENAFWLKDGVHPTPMGHEIIKREWLKAFSEMKGENHE